jgi:hypothetical protein
MSHHPLHFPIQLIPWMTMTAQRHKQEDGYYAVQRPREGHVCSGRLEGAASNWWDAFTTAHTNADAITWQKFQDNFHAHHIPSGTMKLKKKKLLSFTQGGMSISEYRDRFTQFSRYALEEVDIDEKRQERFLEGLIGPLNYQLQSHSFPNFQTLLNKAIGLESKRRELSDRKRKFQGQSSRNT